MIFKDRVDAALKLVRLLSQFKTNEVVVYALPRGGVVLGYEIAKALRCPLDLIITRKIGHPDSPEYAIGAVAENGHLILNKEASLEVSQKYIKEEASKQRLEAKRRREIYLGGRKPVSCEGKIAILVDDGIATGLTIKAAIKELKTHYNPKKIIVAVPIVTRKIADELEKERVRVVSIVTTKEFLGSVGEYYQDFPQVSDQEVLGYLMDISPWPDQELEFQQWSGHHR